MGPYGPIRALWAHVGPNPDRAPTRTGPQPGLVRNNPRKQVVVVNEKDRIRSEAKRFEVLRHSLRNDVRFAGLLAQKQETGLLCKQALAYGIINKKHMKVPRDHFGPTSASVFDDIREHAELAISLRQYFTMWYSAANGSSRKPPLFIKTGKWKRR